MIKTEGLCKKFGKKVVFEDADIEIESGSICGLVGVNGAGKSTLMRILSGVIAPDGGEVLIEGKKVFENESVKKKVFFLPDDPYYNSSFTVESVKALYSAFYNFDSAKFNYYINLFKLDCKKPVRNFSKGMKRQLFIAAALACNPEYLFLDEAFDGLDPFARLEFKRGLIQLQEVGCTVIIASHSLRELEDICDSFILIDGATVINCGKIDAAVENLVKLQLAFNGDIKREDLPFECLRYEKTGRIITVVVRGDGEEIKNRLSPLNPVVVETLPMDFEDLFIEEIREQRK